MVGEREEVYEELWPGGEQRHRAREPPAVEVAPAKAQVDALGAHAKQRGAGQRVDHRPPLDDAELLDSQRIRADGDRGRDEFGVHKPAARARRGT